jgi:hypothetical protein
MKTILALCVLLTAFAAEAQPTNATPANTGPSAQALFGGTRTDTTINLEPLRLNEIVTGRFVFSGSLVEAVKSPNPLQLLNPLAPAQYGSYMDNVVKDPISGKVTGLKLFAIRF